MSKHDFYADPTFFDHCQASAHAWLCARCGKIYPYGWVIGFSLLGVLLLGIAVSVAVVTLSGNTGEFTPVWNHSLARGVTVVTSLAAAQLLFCEALGAWPTHVKMPRALYSAGRFVGWKPPARRPEESVRRVPKAAEKCKLQDQQSIQEFFSAVRDAGVNVAIARALFAAGIRSPQQLLIARDEKLRAIRGVGPATIRKLRAHFEDN